MNISIWKSVILSIVLILSQQRTCHAANDSDSTINTTGLIVLGSILTVVGLIGTTIVTATENPRREAAEKRAEEERVKSREIVKTEFENFKDKLPKSIALLDLSSNEFLFDNLAAEFINDRRFNVIDRSALEKIRQEQKLQTRSEMDEQSAVAMGKLSGIKAIVFVESVDTKISKGQEVCENRNCSVVGYENFTNTLAYLRAVDVQNGSVIASMLLKSFPNVNNFGAEIDGKLPKQSVIAIFTDFKTTKIISSCRMCKNPEISNFRISQGSIETILINKGFSVVDRSSLDKIRSEQKIQMSEEFDSKTAVSIGKFSGADVIIDLKVNFVYITESGISNVGFTARAIDVQSGKVLFSQRF